MTDTDDEIELLEAGREFALQESHYKVVARIGSGGMRRLRSRERREDLGSQGLLSRLSKAVTRAKRPNPDGARRGRQLDRVGGTTTALGLDISALVDAQRREYESLSAIAHPHILRVRDRGEIVLTEAERERGALPPHVDRLPVLVSELIHGKRIDHAIVAYGMSATELAQALPLVGRALEHLHQKHGYLHVDIKPANVLVQASTRQPVLIDFALYKNLNFDEVPASDETRFECDWDLFPELPSGDPLRRLLESNRASRQEIHDLAFPGLDFFQFGHLLRAVQPMAEAVFDRREREYLQVLADSLLDWDEVKSLAPADLVPRLERMDPRRSVPFGIPELSAPRGVERAVPLPEGRSTPLTPAMAALVDTRSFQRLSLINQLSLLHWVFPGCDYKRATHCLFSYELARQLVVNLYGTPRFRLYFDERAVQQLLAVTLLHDINHFPFLHIIQELESELSQIKTLDLVCDGELTGEHAEGKPSIYDLVGELGIDRNRFRALVLPRVGAALSPVDSGIVSILDSGVDLDKLSYLYLDAYFTGVNYGRSLNFASLFQAASVAEMPDGRIHLVFADRALPALRM